MGVKLAVVATTAGVSTATASRALRGLTGVSDETRDRVRRVADELGYKFDPTSALGAFETTSMAVIAPFINRWYYSNVINGIDEVSRSLGIELLLYTFGDLEGRDRVFHRHIFTRRAEAFIVVSVELQQEEIEALSSLGAPVVLIGTQVPKWSSVCIDDYRGACSAVQHLINLGHKRVGLISAFPDDPLDFTVNRDRRRAFFDTLAQAGLTFDPNLETYGSFAISSGERAMDELLARSSKPTAVFIESDEMAFGALRSIARHGLRVPEDMSIVGFDDHEMSEVLGLTTVAQPVHMLGEIAAYALIERLRSRGMEPIDIHVPTNLVVRTSTQLVSEPHV
jgi:DNA-binding LacI/PurR family transcriptional regulator